MDLSVVIPAWNVRAVLEDTLRRLDPEEGVFEVIVVDDGSTDGTPEMLSSLRLRTPLRVLSQPNRGRAAARNLGAAGARAPALLFLDADVRATPGLIGAHARHHRGRGRVGVQGRTLEDPATLSTVFMRATHLLPDLTIRRRERLSPLHVVTRNFSVAREAFQEVGGFDEAFRGYGWEDIELGFRLARAGVRLRYEPEALAYHHHPQTLSDLLPKMRQAGEGAVYFWEKHGRASGLGLFLEIHPVLLPLKRLVYSTGLITALVERVRPWAEHRQVLAVCSECYTHLLWRAYYQGVFEARRGRRAASSAAPERVRA